MYSNKNSIDKISIAIIGIRGISVVYSAFETFAEVLTTKLAKNSYTCAVYCREKYIRKNIKIYKGVKLVTLPSIERKNFATLTHSLLSTIHACLIGKYNIVLYLGVGSTPFSFIPRLFGTKTIVHIDGLDWKRKKWGFIAKNYLKFSERLTTILPNKVITDSHYMVNYYKKKYSKDIEYIPYGYFGKSNYRRSSIKTLKKYNLEKRNYFVWVGRLVPENLLEEFISAFMKLKSSNIKCVVIGDDLYQEKYKEELRQLIKKDRRIIHTGFINHSDTLYLVANSAAYIETKRSGGTHISLIEAMGTGALVISNNNTANIDALGKTALYYKNKNAVENLSLLLENVTQKPKNLEILRKQVKSRAQELYDWKNIIKEYEVLFQDLYK